jgi:hypothetical protein
MIRESEGARSDRRVRKVSSLDRPQSRASSRRSRVLLGAISDFLSVYLYAIALKIYLSFQNDGCRPRSSSECYLPHLFWGRILASNNNSGWYKRVEICPITCLEFS